MLNIRICEIDFFFAGLCFALTNFSCKKNIEDNGSGSNGQGNTDKYGVVYYDCYSTAGYPSPTTVEESYRVCFDMNKNELRWKKKNEFLIPISLISSGNMNEQNPSTKPFLYQNSIIKIFASYDSLGAASPLSGIYFQRIDITSGEALISKRIIEPGDFNIGRHFIISMIATDGQNFYFSCNNGYVYCINEQGNLVWKKGSYSFATVPFHYRYSFFYYDEGRIYFQTINNTNPITYSLICLAANTGDLLWSTPGLENGMDHELIFSKDHLVLFEAPFDGRNYIIKKSSGQQLIENTLPHLPGVNRQIPIGAINDNTVAYFDRTGVGISHINVTQPGVAKTISLSENIYPLSSIFYKGNVFSVRITAATQIAVHGINPNTGIIWKKSMPLTTPRNQSFRLRYFASNDKLYILCSAHFENNQWWESSPVANQMPFSLVVLDVSSGAILKHYNNFPGGIAVSFMPGFYVTDYQYMYNLLVTE